MRAARKAGAIPLVEVRHTRVNREIVRDTNEKHATLVRDLELARMKKVQAYIAIRGTENANEKLRCASERMSLYSRLTRPVLNYRCEQNPLVRAALANTEHGPGRRHEHGSF
jgi:aminopeptidase